MVVWSGLRHLPKRESRAIVQPFIFGMQILSLTLLAVERPQTFGATFWVLLATTIPIVLLGTLMGVKLYRSLSDVNFRRVTFILLGRLGRGAAGQGGRIAASAGRRDGALSKDGGTCDP